MQSVFFLQGEIAAFAYEKNVSFIPPAASHRADSDQAGCLFAPQTLHTEVLQNKSTLTCFTS